MTENELVFIKKKISGKQLVVLVGMPNCGKTTTLFEVARQLAKERQSDCQECCIDAAFNTFINPDGSRSDIRVILPIEDGKYIYFSTFGDTLDVIDNNLRFFTDSLNHSLRLYLAHETGLKRIDWSDLKDYPTTVCVTACSYPQNGRNRRMAEQMKKELEFVGDKGTWIPKKEGIKLPDGTYDNSQMIAEILEEIESQLHKTGITTK